MAEEKKIYPSFHDLSPRDYMYFPKGTIDPVKPGKFSKIETTHILISITALTIAFSFWLSGGLLFNRNLYSILISIPYAFAGVVTAFFFHEISHKFMAQKFGLWAEYRLYPLGIVLSVVIALFTGFIFAAPGAVMFIGGSRSHETGRIAMAGPLANIIIASITLPLYFVFFESIIGLLFGIICLINVILATFNLLPFGPLDGVKIIRWNATAWIIMLIISLVLLITIFPQSSIIINRI